MDLIKNEPLRPGQPADDPYYRKQGELWAPISCPLCRSCWLIVKSPYSGRLGKCIHSGPFTGVYLANPADPPLNWAGDAA